ncbi:MAG: glutamyl-tRNA reductase, partial [Proteobacteria bacterium]|nr:glutamyl-tRNA reductase [Pseudomonadota bacterium]
MNKNIYLVGLNHRTAGVEIREKYALTDLEDFERSIMDNCPVRECIALSTCNRVEIICVGNDDTDDVAEQLLVHWATSCGGDPEILTNNTYTFAGMDAVQHLFTVASSLDSMVMGEPQILGQLKDAFRSAVNKNTTSVILNRLLHKSFSVAKRVRTETAVASSAVSISFAAVELARKIFGDLNGKNAMLIGAGEMAELAATHLLKNGVEKLIIANRTLSRAKELAETIGGIPISFEEFADHLIDVDIVISSTGAPTAVIHTRDIKAVLKARKHRPMFFIDIAVPRDIDPDVNQLDNVYLYDIDDLKEVVEENMAQRQDEASKARLLVDEETENFANWLNHLELQPTIVDIRSRSEVIARRELQRTLKRLGPVDADTR